MNDIYYYSKLYDDTFDATGWRLIFNEPYPIPAYATMIYFVILTESTKAEGVLMRDSNRAYTTDQLMALCHIRASDAEEVKTAFRTAFSLLRDEGIITVDGDGVIRICLSDELFGSETEEARMQRDRRRRKSGLGQTSDAMAQKNAEEPSDGQESNDDLGQSSVKCPSSVRQVSAECPSNDGQSSAKSRTSKFPLNEDVSSSKPPKRQETRDKNHPPVKRPSAAAMEFLEIYPKRINPKILDGLLSSLTEKETEALLIATRRYAKDPGHTEEGGRYAMDPAKFINSRPWTENDLKDADAIIWGRRQDEAMKGGQTDAE